MKMYFSLFFLDFHNNKSDLLLLPTDNILIFRLSNVATALNLATPIFKCLFTEAWCFLICSVVCKHCHLQTKHPKITAKSII